MIAHLTEQQMFDDWLGGVHIKDGATSSEVAKEYIRSVVRARAADADTWRRQAKSWEARHWGALIGGLLVGFLCGWLR